MSNSQQKHRIEGVIPPMITPLNEDFSLDKFHLKKLVNHLIDGGVHGIFLLGTTGEFAGLSSVVKIELIEETCRLVQGRVPILVGITDCSYEESIRISQVAKNSGAHFLVAAPPFYMNVGQLELIHYYQKLADDVSLPLFLYNMPSHTKLFLDVDTVRTLAEHPNIVGLKDSSANGAYFQRVSFELKELPDFLLLVGPEEMTAETVLLGGHGGVNGGANLFPSLYVDLYQAAKSNQHEQVLELQQKVMEVCKNIYENGSYKSGYLMGLKTAMSYMGLCKDNFSLPLLPFQKQEKDNLKERLTKVLNLLEPVEYSDPD